MIENRYGLVIPTNSFRILALLLERHKIDTDMRIRAVAHGRALTTYSEPKSDIDAQYFITSQPTLNLVGKQWIKPKKIMEAIDRLQIPDIPIQQTDLILPSQHDGKKHATSFALLNPHSPMFKKMARKGDIPRSQLLKIHRDFRYELRKVVSKSVFRFLKSSIMLMVDVNPGKQEMFDKAFVLGLRPPFMQKVVASSSLWECTDYEVI